ncbi:MAG: hypothetical protein IPJ34_35595 [Myxococcales bacterium]|nr:hypothetical protein [Myxococcales bacterium]
MGPPVRDVGDSAGGEEGGRAAPVEHRSRQRHDAGDAGSDLDGSVFPSPTPSASPSKASSPPQPAKPKPNPCDPPYRWENGIKKFKPECL